SDWLLLWSGCMLLPAVHFCSEVTLRPWFFDERYWYVPLFPLIVFAGVLLTHETLLSSACGSLILAFTLPGPIGLFLAAGSFLLVALFLRRRPQEEVQQMTVALFLMALAVLSWQRCSEIRLRADDALQIHSQLRKIIADAPPNRPLALLEFAES